MISLRSAYQYTFTNSLVMTFAFLQYSAGPLLLPYLIFRNFALVYLIDYITMNRILYMSPSGIYELHTVQAATIEYMALSLLPTMHPAHLRNLVTFVPLSFVFEVIYDFFFYWAHLLSHVSNSRWHKQHHQHVHLMPILAFYNHPVDELLLYLVPLVSTTRLIHMVYPLSAFELALLVTYKVYIEITGHISYSSKRKCSFQQCIWLPRSLGIELYSDDHATHHAYSNCNFGKRFTLWDRVFETYRSQNIST